MALTGELDKGKTMTLELTNEEANALLNFIDLGVKATGLGSAEAAVVLAKKIQDAAKAAVKVAE
jgi:hypothetical protein